MNVTMFSGRAECWVDWLRFLNIVAEGAYPLQVTQYRGEKDFQHDFEFKTTMGRETILELMTRVPDGHVMRGTLRPVPLAENSLERERVPA